MHIFLFIYSVCFLLYFDCQSIDAGIFIVVIMMILFSWKLFDCCIFSFYELKLYGLDHSTYFTDFHPCLFILFREYRKIILLIMDLIIFFTFYTVIIQNIWIPFFMKIICSFLFIYIAFIDNIINPTISYPTEYNSVLTRLYTFAHLFVP